MKLPEAIEIAALDAVEIPSSHGPGRLRKRGAQRSIVVSRCERRAQTWDQAPGNKLKTSELFVCLLRRGYRVDGAFLSKCGRSDSSPRALRPPGNPATGARTAAALQTRWRCRRFALGTAVLLWATNTLLNTCQGRRLAQPALKLCSWREQRRDLGTCPTFLPLNAKLVACRTSKMESLRSVPLRFPPF